MPIFYQPARGYYTPPVVVIGDDIASGISYKMSESTLISRSGIKSDYLETLIDRDVSVWPYIRNRPWIVIACGTNDGVKDYYPRMKRFREKLNPVSGQYAGENNPHIIWVYPLNNSWARNNISRIASEYGDLTLDMPMYAEQTKTVVAQEPVYYPWPWSVYYNSPPNVMRYQTVYRNVTENVWLSNDRARPNQAGYYYIVNALRKMTNNWKVRYN